MWERQAKWWSHWGNTTAITPQSLLHWIKQAIAMVIWNNCSELDHAYSCSSIKIWFEVQFIELACSRVGHFVCLNPSRSELKLSPSLWGDQTFRLSPREKNNLFKFPCLTLAVFPPPPVPRECHLAHILQRKPKFCAPGESLYKYSRVSNRHRTVPFRL